MRLFRLLAAPFRSPVAAGRRRRSLALAVRLFECGSESEVARTVLTLSAAALFERYLAGRMSLGEVSPGIAAASIEAGERIVPFPRPAPAEGA